MPAACLLSVCLSRAVERGQDGGDVRVTVCMTRVCLWREAFGILPFFFFFFLLMPRFPPRGRLVVQDT